MSHARKSANFVSHRDGSFLVLVVISFALSVVSGCASTQYSKGTEETEKELVSSLKVTRLPISVKLEIDEATRNFAVVRRLAGVTTSATPPIRLPVGQQLMVGIRKAAVSVFRDVQKQDFSNFDAVLKIKLLRFDVEAAIKMAMIPYDALEYDMSMVVDSVLTSKDGTKLYGKQLTLKNSGQGKYPTWKQSAGYTASAAKGSADLVALWVRAFTKDVSEHPKVTHFAHEIAALVPMAAQVGGPEITIFGLTSGASTNQEHIKLVGSINSRSAIKKLIMSVNGRPLKQTRGIAVVSSETGVIRLDRRIPLSMGENVISITATNEAGGTSQRVVSIIRTEPALVTAADLGRSSKIGEHWAVVIGISNYKHSDKGIPNLNNAAIDARTFADFLKSPRGGGFNEKNVLLLTNDQATSSALRRALFTFLKKAIEEDLVIFFFSGQGAHEPGNPDNYYLLTYDSDPDDLPSTGIPTWDVDIAFQRNVKARRIVIIADASHVSNVGKASGARSVVRSNLINRYLKRLSESGEGKAIFTATQEGQLSIKTRSNGRKTGLFTHYLLEALSGAADENNDGIVSLGEAIDYTTDLVSAASRGKQRPDIAGNFDRDLPLAIIE